MAIPTEQNWHNAPLSRIELCFVVERCNDASTEAACLMTDCTRIEICERIDLIVDALKDALAKIRAQRDALEDVLHDEQMAALESEGDR